MNRSFNSVARLAAGVLLTLSPSLGSTFYGRVIVNLYAPEGGGGFVAGPSLDNIQTEITGAAGLSQANTPWANQQPDFTTISVGPVAGWAGGLDGGEVTLYSHARGPAFDIYNPHDVFASVFVPYDYTYVIEADPGNPGDSAWAQVLINIEGYGKQLWIKEEVTNGTMACLICTGVISFVLPPNSTSSVRVQDAAIWGRATSDGFTPPIPIDVPGGARTPEPSAGLLAAMGISFLAIGKVVGRVRKTRREPAVPQL